MANGSNGSKTVEEDFNWLCDGAVGCVPTCIRAYGSSSPISSGAARSISLAEPVNDAPSGVTGALSNASNMLSRSASPSTACETTRFEPSVACLPFPITFLDVGDAGCRFQNDHPALFGVAAFSLFKIAQKYKSQRDFCT